ncbi:MAG: T9SS type A sorting domain-containing protein, partial [Bacteroidetes bacterium]|nr:T9SS type A sorting domain-containing protein [Bacteroidota bacterium]
AGEGIHVSDYLYTPKIDLSSYANNPVTVRFKYTLRLYMDYDHLYFVWKTPEGDRWNIQEEITKPSGFGWPWAEKEIDLPVEALVADVQFGFLYDDNNEHGWGAGIDDFQLFVNTTSIFDLELASRVTVFPNPNNGHFEVKITDSKPGTLSLEVSDLAGRTIYSKSYPAGTINVSEAIDLTKYSNGLYNLTIRNGNAVYVTKLTIQ